jgi:hypothetical protein
MHNKMHGHATAIGQTSLFGCSSAGHSGINQLGGVYVNGTTTEQQHAIQIDYFR